MLLIVSLLAIAAAVLFGLTVLGRRLLRGSLRQNTKAPDPTAMNKEMEQLRKYGLRENRHLIATIFNPKFPVIETCNTLKGLWRTHVLRLREPSDRTTKFIWTRE
jgi:hypothetical protein